MGITLKQLTDTVSLIKDYVLHKTYKIDQISYAQKTVNTELDYCFLKLGNNEKVVLTANYILPFILYNGNMENNESNFSVFLRAGKTYKISLDVYISEDGYVVFNIFDITNNKNIWQSVKVVANANAGVGCNNAELIYIPENDCEIQIKVNNTSGNPVLNANSRSYFIIQEIGREVLIDPVEYINTTQGIEDTPVGHIISHMGTIAPKHYLVCDGSEYNIVDYPYLAQHIIDNFGSVNHFGGDGIDTFCVPQVENDTIESMSCIKYEPTYFMIVNKDTTEEANAIYEQNELLRQQNALLQEEIDTLEEMIIAINRTREEVTS